MLVFDSLSDPKLVEMLKNGAVGVLPTDTIYGLACSAHMSESVQRLYKLKQRENKPGTLIAANIDQLVELGIPKRYLTAVEQYWPNPISVVVPSVPSLAYLDMGKMSLAVRIPADEHIANLLQKTGPLQTSSANLTGEKTAVNLSEAKAYFGDEVDFYVDGGDLSNRKGSTVIRVIDDAVEVIREGAVKINEKGEIEP